MNITLRIILILAALGLAYWHARVMQDEKLLRLILFAAMVAAGALAVSPRKKS